VRLARGLWWWTITIVTLVLVDDFVFGPVFWSLALLSRAAAVTLAFLASWFYGSWLVFRGTREQPGRFAEFLLNRLWLERRNPEVEQRARRVHSSVTSVVAATIATPFIGGVLPSLILHKRDLLPQAQIRRLAVFLCALYAVEFAAIHGYGLGGAARALVRGLM
jgi:hypothetical protein